ncbi:hypothetical protein PRVXT_001584 [Proteinivorax tanatarense]|uniref:Uncharacterized protein n=1 Tax=Proteinivorax tanatarense TaxID=1260629 RepID=A0AAU7VHK2_9FIRM
MIFEPLLDHIIDNDLICDIYTQTAYLKNAQIKEYEVSDKKLILRTNSADEVYAKLDDIKVIGFDAMGNEARKRTEMVECLNKLRAVRIFQAHFQKESKSTDESKLILFGIREKNIEIP